jgi:hypothetical protein
VTYGRQAGAGAPNRDSGLSRIKFCRRAPVQTGEEEVVQVHYDEGLATHIDPEPCVHVREGLGEASVGACIGQPLNRERNFTSDADAVSVAEGNTEGSKRSLVPIRSGVVVDPGMCTSSSCGNREISCPTE